MKLAHQLGMVAGTALLAASGFASAATIYHASGVIVASSCGAISPNLAVGHLSESTVIYPGQGALGMQLVSPNSSGPGTASFCSTTAAADVTGASAMPFSCYTNNIAQGKTLPTGATPLSITYTASATSVNAGTQVKGAALNTESVAVLDLGSFKCSFTTDATWVAQ